MQSMGISSSGCVPPLWGSAVYRSAMMSSYEATYTASSSARRPTRSGARILWWSEAEQVISPVLLPLSVSVEAPIEQAKVMRQTVKHQYGQLYRGFWLQTWRTRPCCC